VARYTYEVIGPAAANGWQCGGHESRLSTAAAAWEVVAKIAKRSDPQFAEALRGRQAHGTVDHRGTRYTVIRIA
jgi:hypothetical protein